MRSMNGTRAKSILAGAIGGLAASYVMNQFQSLWAKVAKEPPQESSGEDATVKTAEAISKCLLHHELTDAQKKWAGPAVHYAYGTIVGAVYGALAETVPAAKAGCGAAYGAAVWLAGDEIAVSALGLSQPPSQTPPVSHAKALASHLVYGVTTDLARQAILHIED
ncbi:MAG: hypothetical protein JWP63_457 [Candidatus Solibacter sp.]|nr:hypothetical protein [Candidatus Solibacter sp.]